MLLPTTDMSKVYNYYYVHIFIMLKRHKCTCAGMSALPSTLTYPHGMFTRKHVFAKGIHHTLTHASSL